MHFSCLLTFACAGNIDPTLTPPAESVPSLKNRPAQCFSRSRCPASERLPWGTAGVRLIVRPLQWAVVSDNSGVYVYASYTHQIPGGQQHEIQAVLGLECPILALPHITPCPTGRNPPENGDKPTQTPYSYSILHVQTGNPRIPCQTSSEPLQGASLASHPGSHS